MPLFVCPECQTVENTALGVYVLDKKRDLIDQICSACGPGGWHGEFPQETYDPEKHGPVDETNGFIRPKAKGGCGCS